MADVNQLFAVFIEAHLAGSNPDPREFIDRLEGAERTELEELIDAYYVDAPPRRWDADAFRGSAAERLTEELDRSFRGQAGMWPALLPRLRNRARLRRGQLVSRLAEALGVSGREEKVATYYHGMEQGLVPSAGVSEKVLKALAEIVGTSAEVLRRAGRPLTPAVSDEEATDAAFARIARPDQDWEPSADVDASHGLAVPAPPARDEVDDLFLGGEPT